MVLVDLQEGEIVPAVVEGIPQVYRFRMNGSVREFAWRVLTKNEYATFKASGELSSSLTAASTDATKLSAKFDQPGTFPCCRIVTCLPKKRVRYLSDRPLVSAQAASPQ